MSVLFTIRSMRYTTIHSKLWKTRKEAGVARKARRDDRGECEEETNKKWKESEDEVLENLEVPYTSDMFKESRDTYIPKNSLEYLEYYNNAKMETE